MSKFEIELPPALSDFIHGQVKAGLYKSASDAIEDAVRRECDGERVRFAALRSALASGLADVEAGRFCDGGMDEIVADARARRRGQG